MLNSQFELNLIEMLYISTFIRSFEESDRVVVIVTPNNVLGIIHCCKTNDRTQYQQHLCVCISAMRLIETESLIEFPITESSLSNVIYSVAACTPLKLCDKRTFLLAFRCAEIQSQMNHLIYPVSVAPFK